MPIIQYETSNVDDSDYIFTNGSSVLTGSLDLGNNKIINLSNPTNNQDAATKNYVDTEIASISFPTSHSDLSNLTSDDHTQYLLVNGTRALTGNLNLSNNKIINLGTPTLDTDAVTKEYVDEQISLAIALWNSVFDWQDSVKDKDLVTSPAGVVGNRYIVAGLGGSWSGGAVNDITEYTSSGWTFTTPNEGFSTWVDDEDTFYAFNGSSWVKLGSFTTHSELQGLTADDHTQYVLANGTRSISGSLTVNGTLTASGVIRGTTVSGTALISSGTLSVTGASTLDGTTASTVSATTVTSTTITGTNITSSSMVSGVNMYATSDIEVLSSGNGLVIKSPSGTRWRIQVTNSGVLTTTSL